MKKVININAAATMLLTDAEHLRVKVEDGVLMIKATGSARANNPYEGEEMTVPSIRSAEGQRDRMYIKTELPVEVGTKFIVVQGAYGWLHFVKTDKVFPSLAGASVSKN